MPKDPDIRRRLDRIEEIIGRLDADEMSFEEGNELYDEGQELLSEIRERLQDGNGDVMEIE